MVSIHCIGTDMFPLSNGLNVSGTTAISIIFKAISSNKSDLLQLPHHFCLTHILIHIIKRLYISNSIHASCVTLSSGIFVLFTQSLVLQFEGLFLLWQILNISKKLFLSILPCRYVRHFEQEETILLNTYFVVRIDGKGFHR